MGEWSGGGGGGEAGGMQEAIVKTRSSCFPLSALKLTIQLFAEYTECHAILMTPQHAQISWFTSRQPPVFI